MKLATTATAWPTASEKRMAEIARIAHYGACHEDVTRKGESQPCCLPAVAIRLDPEDNSPYPVCSRHTRKPLVPLTEIATACADERSGEAT